MTSLPKFAVNRPVTVSMIFLAILILGGISLALLNVEMLPKISIPKIVVETKYGNAAPEEVEELVTRPLEESLSSLEGIKNISSVSSTGKSIIILEFYWQTDIDFAILKAREKLDRVKWNLPENTGRPNILNFDPSESPIISFTITGTNDLYTLSEIGKNILKKRFEQLSGVAKAELSGIVEKEIVIRISPHKLYIYHITPEMIATKIQQLNANYSGGEIIDGWYKYSVLFPKNLQNKEDIENTVIKNNNGDKFYLKDICKIYEQSEIRETIARVNGKDGIVLNIIKNSDANTVEVCKKAKRCADQFNKIQAEMKGEQIRLKLLHDDSKQIIKSINSVVQSILIGGILAFFVLVLFLKGIKPPLTIAFAMPFSIIATFILLYFFGISLNILSMGGLAIGIGLLVDNSIIVLENITRLRENSGELKNACIRGTKEVMLSISAGTFTTIAVFFPIIYLQGVSSIFFKEQALTITFALLSSLVISIIMVPTLLNKKFYKQTFHTPYRNKISFKDKRPRLKLLLPFYFVWRVLLVAKEFLKFIIKTIFGILGYLINYSLTRTKQVLDNFIKPIGEWNEKNLAKVKSKYEKVLNKALLKKEKTFIIIFIIFLASIWAATLIPRRFIPKLTPDKLTVELKQSSGTPLKITQKKMIKIEKFLQKEKYIKNIETYVGKEYGGSGFISYRKNAAHKGYFTLSIKPNSIINIETKKLYLKNKLESLVNADISVLSAGNVYQNIFDFGDYPIEINVYADNLEKLKLDSDLVNSSLTKINKKYHLFSEIKNNLQITKPAFQLEFKDNILRKLKGSISRNDIIKKLKNLNFGYQIDELIYGNQVKNIVIRTYDRSPQKRNLDLTEFLNQKIVFNQIMYSVSDFIKVNKYLSPEELYRKKQQKNATIFIKLTKNIKFQAAYNRVDDLMKKLSDENDFKYDITGENQRIKENFSGVIFAFILSILLVYMILGVQFESFYLPFVIILTIPLSLIGVVWGLLLTGTSINLMSLIGSVVLIGIVVNDSIVKLDTIKRLREQGYELISAVKTAGSQRFRPIIMTSLTTIFGLLPLAIGIGTGSELTKPLAITVISGLFASTVLTLIIIPVIYVIFEQRK